MANEGHIIVKNNDRRTNAGRYSTKQFFGGLDKGSAKPAFCYPRRAEAKREELATMEKNVNKNMISPDRRMIYEQNMKKLADRVAEIDGSFEGAKKIIEKDKDAWATRRANLAAKIAEGTPTRKQERDRSINPHAVLRREKIGEKGEAPLEQMKRDYTIISRAMQASGDYEEANHSFLKKDK